VDEPGTEQDSRFARLARAAHGDIGAGEAALWVAADEYPGLDVGAWLRRLDDLGRAARAAVRPGMDAAAVAAALARLLFEQEGFRGNRDDYYDPRNSFLNDVLDRRLGIPITLAVLYVEAAAGAGVTARGIGLPGHFVVEVRRGDDRCRIDPFGGAVGLDEAACRVLVRQAHGADTAFDAAWLDPVTTGQVVARMLANLKGVYTRRADWPRALRVVERLVTLAPGRLEEVRDRGTIRARLGQRRAAVADWEAYLRGRPDAPDAAAVRDDLRTVRQALAVLN
jgi:regulator of sirC expression with transglutaminase-like and TPR domain